ncbi:Npr1 [Symbiodinium microadriaticum]|nr:Npr1 [Symbiodinium microadriaticum]CAE7945105.1 Npr1 [Symbiodinium sp. KB8]
MRCGRLRTCFAWLILLPSAASSDREELPDAECQVPAVNLLQARLDQTLSIQDAQKPWDVHMYLVGTTHKAGTSLLMQVMGGAFRSLGATYSCQVMPNVWGELVTEDGNHTCADSPDAKIRFDIDVTQESLETVRELSGPGGMRAVMSVRDPAAMLASAYCYHHRGEEYDLWPYPEITSMGPAEGMRLLSGELLRIFGHMTEAFEARQNDTFVVRYENITRSSEDFDCILREMMAFLFEGLVTPEEHEHILAQAQEADLNRRTDTNSTKDQYRAEHTNDEECEKTAMLVLPSLVDIYANITKLQRRLHYA